MLAVSASPEQEGNVYPINPGKEVRGCKSSASIVIQKQNMFLLATVKTLCNL